MPGRTEGDPGHLDGSEPAGREPAGQVPAGPELAGPELAGRVHRVLLAGYETVAVAESLTGGLLGAALTATPGSSATFRGGVIAYATDLKAELLGVPQDLLDRHGAVHPAVAAAMARGVRDRLRATYGLATTGVAGPDGQDGRPVGTVHIAACGPATTAGAWREALLLSGDRAAVREQTVRAALELLLRSIRASREDRG